MSIRVYTVVETQCDGEECDAEAAATVGYAPPDVHPLLVARERLARIGWKSRGSHDWCPDCSTARRREGSA